MYIKLRFNSQKLRKIFNLFILNILHKNVHFKAKEFKIIDLPEVKMFILFVFSKYKFLFLCDFYTC